MRLRAAVDIGGTFTDLVALSETGEITYTKSLTTYDSLANGVMDCVRKSNIDVSSVEVFTHGSTIAINTVIQRKGAKTGLITTMGFRDVYEIGRSNRPDAYNLAYRRPVPLVPRDLRIEIQERPRSDGSVRQPLEEEHLRLAVRKLKAREVNSIAVVFLHSYVNAAHELRAGEIIREEHPDAFVSLSHSILREFREYERTSTTVLNAYVAPIVSRYVGLLENALTEARFSGSFMIMQSNGGVMSADHAKALPVATMESGPVAGVIGAGKLGEVLEIPNTISFDMGGTTAKASLLINGEARVVTGYHIDGYESGHPMMLPVVDIVEVGTGGGSIAWLDSANGLKVGPISAGSDPGPVCYGRGGADPTVTDANLLLGRLDANNFMGGEMRLDVDRAAAAMNQKIAAPLGMTVEQAAFGVIRIADAKMSLAVREVSVAKGHDPRDFALIASGGAGPLHAAAIARELGIPTVIVPELPGTFSAFGMLFADVRHDYVRTMIQPLASVDVHEVNSVFFEMAAEANKTLHQEGIRREAAIMTRTIDMRYRGQEYTLNIGVPSGDIERETFEQLRANFDEMHYARYQHAASSQSVEIVNLRMSALGRSGASDRQHSRISSGERREDKVDAESRYVVFEQGRLKCGVFWRGNLDPGRVIQGPAVIEEFVSTTVVHPGDRATVHPSGAIIIDLGN